ncbi:class II fructose-bisphosphate aldolase [Hutsoniella sourekii]|uniref:class II fructose-bisphosphate aldolase n=1 Tax=Hutsoniella sourekii TaxID=87650 RepID=UPI00048357DF|nr:class II fructose-bisphosphate aldolase [Hutsoniella sourekii]
MLVNFHGVLDHAYKNGYAVGAFNCYNLETTQAVIEVASEKDKPVIIAFGAKYLKNMSLKTMAALTQSLASEAEVPVCLHLDHCDDISVIKQAILAGFTSVMYDGSKLDFEENLKNTQRVVELSHKYGVTVEAELGSLGIGSHSHEGLSTDLELLTDPQSAKKFVERTNVDALAVSVGTVHGLYQGDPDIKFDLLREINDLLKIPLVLHGGSGVPQEDILKCVSLGISKMNVNTEISTYTVQALRDLLSSESPHLSVLSIKEKTFAKDIVEKYINFLS